MKNGGTNSRHRVVIIGCGFGGLFAAKALRHAAVDVTVIDRTNHHLFQPLLYQVATGILSSGDIAPAIREILRHQRNTSVVFGEVVDVDLNSRRVVVDTVGRRDAVAYDSLIVATGASQSYFGHPEYADDAPGLKTIDDAYELRGRIFGAFELAERETDPVAQRRLLTFVIIGAGPTGVEVCGQVAELSRYSLRDNFRRIDPAQARIILLEGGPAILGAFHPSLRERAARDLRVMGVEIHTGTMVMGVDQLGIDTNSTDPKLRRIEAQTKFWAAGVEGSPPGRLIAKAAGVELDRTGRVKVAPDCSVPGYPEVFVIGDLMNFNDLPLVAQVAIQSGQHAARTIIRRLAGDNTQVPFKYWDKGTMATIGRLSAIVDSGPLHLSGVLGWLAWLFIHLVTLTGFRNRLAVSYNWAVLFVSHARRQRVITKQQVFAREALQEKLNATPERRISDVADARM